MVCFVRNTFNTENLIVANGNYEMVPVMVEENSYVFSTVKNQVAEDTTTGATVFRPSLSNSGFKNEVIFANSANNKLSLGLLISRIPVGGTEEQREFSEVFAIDPEMVKTVYSPNATEGKINVFTIKLTGMSEAYEYRVDLVIRHATTVVYSAPIATLPKKTENN